MNASPNNQLDAHTAQPIRFVLSDVDGVFTDGSLAWTGLGVDIKAFHVRDGMGVKLWQRAGFGFGLLSARESNIVRRRAEELGIRHVLQGFEHKLPAARKLIESLELEPHEVCYIGDDLPDIAVMRYVGLPVTVADGVQEARAAAQWVTERRGGRGAVRELVERLLKAKGCWETLIQTYRE